MTTEDLAFSALRAKMKIILQVFGTVMYLTYISSSYRHYGFNNSLKRLHSGNMPGRGDFVNYGRMQRKRYSSFGKDKQIRGANDLLNSYFKIGLFPIPYNPVPSPDLQPRATLQAPKPRTSQPATNLKTVRKLQREKPQQERDVPTRVEKSKMPAGAPVIKEHSQAKPQDVGPKPVKRPIVIIGHKRGGTVHRPPSEWAIAAARRLVLDSASQL